VINDFGAEDGTSDLSNELILAHVYSGYSIGVINWFNELGPGAGTGGDDGFENASVGYCFSEEPAEEAPEEGAAQEGANTQEGDDDDEESSTEGESGAVCYYLKSEGTTEVDEAGDYDNYVTKVRGWSMTPEEWKISKDAGNINNIDYDDIMNGGLGAIAGINAFSHWQLETITGRGIKAEFGHVQKKLPMCYDSVLEEFGVIYEDEGELAELKDSWPYDAAWEKGTKLQLWMIKNFDTNELVQLYSYENAATYV